MTHASRFSPAGRAFLCRSPAHSWMQQMKKEGKKEGLIKKVAVHRRQRLSDLITDQIEQLIVDGKLRPGEALPSERDLAAQLGVSRPSAREALLLLESRGLVGARRGGGYAVTDVTAPTITDPLAHLLQRHPSAVDDILEVRHGLECVAAYFAASRASDADVKRLRERAAMMKRQRRKIEPAEMVDLDVDFHMAIAEASHNVALVHVMRGIFNLMRINILRAREAMYHQEDALGLLDEQHMAIAEAIASRDAAAARTAANVHLSFTQVSLRELGLSAAHSSARAGGKKKEK